MKNLNYYVSLKIIGILGTFHRPVLTVREILDYFSSIEKNGDGKYKGVDLSMIISCLPILQKYYLIKATQHSSNVNNFSLARPSVIINQHDGSALEIALSIVNRLSYDSTRNFSIANLCANLNLPSDDSTISFIEGILSDLWDNGVAGNSQNKTLYHSALI